MYQMKNRLTYGDLLKIIFLNSLIQGLFAIFCYSFSQTAFENFHAIFMPLLIFQTTFFIFVILKGKDWKLTLIILLLLQIGITLQCLNTEGKTLVLLLSHILGVGLGLVLILIFQKFTQANKWLLLGFIFLNFSCLIILWLFGQDTNGAILSIQLLSFDLQLTEISKFLTLICLGIIFSSAHLSDTQKYISAILLLGIDFVFFLLFNELGTPLILGLVFLGATYLCLDQRYTKINFIGLGLLFVIVITIIFLVMQCPHLLPDVITTAGLKVYERLMLFIAPSHLSSDLRYQSNCVKEAIVSGGLLGTSQAINIPVGDSDFAYTSLILKMGWLTGLVVAILFTCFTIVALRQTLEKKNTLYLCISLMFVLEISIRAFYSMAYNASLVPATGIVTPFISASGSATTTLMAMVLWIIFMDTTRRKRKCHQKLKHNFI